MRPKEYEQLVSEVAARIVARVDAAPATRVLYGPTSHVRGASGYDHQIDVAIVGINAQLLIECKHWTHTVDVPRFLEFAARVHDIRATSNCPPVTAALATTVGFQSGITVLAAFFNVNVHIVKSADEFALIYKDALTLTPKGSEAQAQTGTPTVGQTLLLSPVGSEVTSQTGPST